MQRLFKRCSKTRDVKRGQILEAEAETQDRDQTLEADSRTLRSRPRPKPNLKRPNRTMY